MNTKSTLFLLVVAAGLLGFIQLYDRHRLSTREADERDQFVLAFDRSAVAGIVITSNEDEIKLHRNSSRWEVEAPVQDRADQNAINEILTQCAMLHKEVTMSGKGIGKKQLKDFGLTKSKLRLKLIGEGAPPELLFGKETAVDGKSYVRLEDSNSVYVVSNELRNLIARKADDLRDHRLTEVDAAHVIKIEFKTSVGEIELEKTGDHWSLTRPLRARADDRKVNDFIASLLNTSIVAFAPDKGANLSSYGLAEPRGTVTFSTLADGKPITLEIGADADKADNIYARLSNREAVCLLPKRIERLLTLKPNELRDRRLLRLDLDFVDRITVEPAGQLKLIFQRRQEDWVQVDGRVSNPVNPAKVRAMVQALQTREISGFVADVASDLAKYGLDHPQLRVTFSSFSSENTAESNAGERPFLSVAFGNAEGNTVYARVEDEPFIVAVDKSILQEISINPVEWRPLSIFKVNPEEIIAVDVTYQPETDGRAVNRVSPVSMVRNGKSWQLASGPGSLNSINAQSLVNTLVKLGAVRWNSRNTSPMGTPSEIITVKTVDGKSQKLLLGSPAADQTCNAMVEGDAAGFSISGPDESALRLPLLNP